MRKTDLIRVPLVVLHTSIFLSKMNDKLVAL